MEIRNGNLRYSLEGMGQYKTLTLLHPERVGPEGQNDLPSLKDLLDLSGDELPCNARQWVTTIAHHDLGIQMGVSRRERPLAYPVYQVDQTSKLKMVTIPQATPVTLPALYAIAVREFPGEHTRDLVVVRHTTGIQLHVRGYQDTTGRKEMSR